MRAPDRDPTTRAPETGASTGGTSTGGTGPIGIAILTALGALVAVWPLTAVLRPGRWSADAALVAGGMIVAGCIVRLLLRRRSPAARIVLVILAQLAAGIAMIAFREFRDQAFLGIVPTSDVLGSLPALAAQVGDEIYYGTAPLEPSRATAVLVALGAAIIALLLDALIALARSPLATILLVAAIGVVPSIAVPRPAVDVVWFVALAVLLLLLLRIRAESPLADRRPSSADPTGSPAPRRPVAATAMGAAAIAVAVAVGPLLPVSATGIELGGGSTTLSPTLRLGEDLRRPNPSTALTLITDADSAPYLRIATLSAFDGEVWQPDQWQTSPLGDGFGADPAPEGVTVRGNRTTIRTTGVSGSWLPVPYQASSVRGLAGEWSAMTDNRTVIAANADAAEQNYTVDSLAVRPSLEQIRATSSADAPSMDAFRALPDGMPAVIRETAEQVAGTDGDDYDRLLALQTWFRAGFRYSLETPVEEGFDGTGADAVVRFLERREGYCVHFAGAFALMARSLGMPTRIVVGYLPGTPMDERQKGRPVYVVSSDQLHSWPEVYFEGIGWIPFEPTATLGVPTRFDAATPTDTATTAPSIAPTTAPSVAPEATGAPRTDLDPGAGGAVAQRPLDPYPVLWTVLAIAAVLLLPAAIRALLRTVHRRRASRGDAMAAWAEVRDTLRDLGLPASSAESPRTRGNRLVRERDVDADAVRVLVTAVERASYARAEASTRASGSADTADLAGAVQRIRSDLRHGASGRDRLLATFAPRSLFGGRLAASSVG
ncbi:transglutaminase-like putative cysteine protease [Microbacterium resistens]|uniref:Transglutaminase-like putative cysteine protease n=1 Tax=Microbacterium resistens TaxID=156977 RepID=A0ABU1SHC4_9MICO|nr:DUF3488 and transglutaminase-like domain-containing protein [Microbacterium resistens]MDR6868995.1 transglutaminase-like putative cysteine protease [Microbacterium resistens]